MIKKIFLILFFILYSIAYASFNIDQELYLEDPDIFTCNQSLESYLYNSLWYSIDYHQYPGQKPSLFKLRMDFIKLKVLVNLQTIASAEKGSDWQSPEALNSLASDLVIHQLPIHLQAGQSQVEITNSAGQTQELSPVPSPPTQLQFMIYAQVQSQTMNSGAPDYFNLQSLKIRAESAKISESDTAFINNDDLKFLAKLHRGVKFYFDYSDLREKPRDVLEKLNAAKEDFEAAMAEVGVIKTEVEDPSFNKEVYQHLVAKYFECRNNTEGINNFASPNVCYGENALESEIEGQFEVIQAALMQVIEPISLEKYYVNDKTESNEFFNFGKGSGDVSSWSQRNYVLSQKSYYETDEFSKFEECVDTLVIHHTEGTLSTTLDSIDRSHRSRHDSSIAYHKVLKVTSSKDESVPLINWVQTRPDRVKGSHAGLASLSPGQLRFKENLNTSERILDRMEYSDTGTRKIGAMTFQVPTNNEFYNQRLAEVLSAPSERNCPNQYYNANSRTIGIGVYGDFNKQDPSDNYGDISSVYKPLAEMICQYKLNYPHLRFVTTHRFIKMMGGEFDKNCPGKYFDLYYLEQLMSETLCKGTLGLIFIDIPPQNN